MTVPRWPSIARRTQCLQTNGNLVPATPAHPSTHKPSSSPIRLLSHSLASMPTRPHILPSAGSLTEPTCPTPTTPIFASLRANPRPVPVSPSWPSPPYPDPTHSPPVPVLTPPLTSPPRPNPRRCSPRYHRSSSNGDSGSPAVWNQQTSRLVVRSSKRSWAAGLVLNGVV
ncbi:uncharacterized protein LOC126991605 [Eriocheir sinensis]|uniref:uncharacterized protein LOC126991605 n=1 Tax=Eriocheir sinensis TaxID=95602 RepID=UPI0021C5AD3C|nr:uncharacterized protein LOC126991605 [Eriocheir sinensis]